MCMWLEGVLRDVVERDLALLSLLSIGLFSYGSARVLKCQVTCSSDEHSVGVRGACSAGCFVIDSVCRQAQSKWGHKDVFTPRFAQRMATETVEMLRRVGANRRFP